MMDEELKCFVCSMIDVDSVAITQKETREGIMPLCGHCLSIYESLNETGALDCLKDLREDGD